MTIPSQGANEVRIDSDRSWDLSDTIIKIYKHITLSVKPVQIGLCVLKILALKILPEERGGIIIDIITWISPFFSLEKNLDIPK